MKNDVGYKIDGDLSKHDLHEKWNGWPWKNLIFLTHTMGIRWEITLSNAG